MVFLEFLYRVLREQKSRLIIVVVFMAVVALMEGVTVALLVPLMNVVMGEGGTLPGALGNVGVLIENASNFFNIKLSLIVVLVMITATFVIQGLFRLLMWHLQARMLTKYEFSLIHKIFDSYLASSWGFFVRSRAGQLVNTLSVETNRATIAFQSSCELLAAFLITVFYIILSLLLSWQIALVGIVLCLAASLVLKKFMERAHSYGLGTSNANSELQAYAFDKLATAKLLKSSATEKAAVDNIDAIANRRVRFRYLSWMNSALVPSIYQPLVIAALALMIFFALVQLKLNFAIVLLFSYIFFRLTPYFSSLQLSYQQTLLYIPAVQEIDKTIELARSMVEVKGGKEAKSLRKAISFADVGFAYQDGVFVLKEVNLEIKRGESVAIVGESGVGKTTVVDLLLGLYTPTKGRILVDDIPLSDYDLASWRKLIGHISQDVFLFHDTIEANLKWMVPEASAKQVEAAARAAHAHEFIMEARKGYNAVIGDRGVRLSGGQRQRLALARMILRNPEIIVLDEATSALDAESEAKVQETVEKISSDKTVIVISHRSSMLRNVDRIYMLEDGSIREVS
ncbi:ABC transporter ATP-binding protein, partial [Chloroflexota bacterium]